MRKSCWSIGKEDIWYLVEFAAGKYAALARPRKLSTEQQRSYSIFISLSCQFFSIRTVM